MQAVISSAKLYASQVKDGESDPASCLYVFFRFLFDVKNEPVEHWQGMDWTKTRPENLAISYRPCRQNRLGITVSWLNGATIQAYPRISGLI